MLFINYRGDFDINFSFDKELVHWSIKSAINNRNFCAKFHHITAYNRLIAADDFKYFSLRNFKLKMPKTL